MASDLLLAVVVYGILMSCQGVASAEDRVI
jgi:hypothetical protein